MMALICVPPNPYSHSDPYHCCASGNGIVLGSSYGVTSVNLKFPTTQRSLVLWQPPLSSFAHGNALHIDKASADVPDYLSTTWDESRGKRPVGPRLDLTVEQIVKCWFDALKYNNEPHQDHGIEVMYRFTSFDLFKRSKYFGPFFDLGQFERFRRIFHHSTYRVLLSHKESKILSSLYVGENCFKQRVWIRGSRPEEEEFT